MQSVRPVIVGVLAALFVSIAPPALAQPQRGEAPALRVDDFDVEQVPQLGTGTQLNFSLYGTPGAAAALQIEGAQRELALREVEPGIYEGSYTILAGDRIAPDGRVVATLQRGEQWARSLLREPLLLGAATPVAGGPWRGTTVPVEPAPPTAMAGCADCAVVESIREVEVADGSSHIGAVAGGVAGAIFGDRIGRAHERHVRHLTRVLGAIGGALGGRAIEKKAAATTRHEVVLRLPGGATQLRSYDQAPPFRVGDTVRLGAGLQVGPAATPATL